MQITEIYYERNFQIAEFLFEKMGCRIAINGDENVDSAYEQAEKIVREQHYIKNKDNSFYAQPKSDEDLPVTQVQEQPKYTYPVATDDDVIKEMQTYKLGVNAFISVYSEMVKGNPKLEEAYQLKLKQLSNA